MLPSVARQPNHFLPHQHNQPFYSPDGFYGSHDHNVPSFQNDPLLQQQQQHQHHQRHRYQGGGTRNSLHLGDSSRILRFPHLVDRPSAQPMNNPVLPSASLSAENTLRRKTPNGTLAAGYDATPGDRSIQQPANKHILVSSLDSNLMTHQRGISIDPLQYKPLDTHTPPFAQNLNFSSSTSRINNALPPNISQDPFNASWIRSLNPGSQGFDSIPKHSPNNLTGDQRYFWQNVPTVPTVLASSFHTGAGGHGSGGPPQYGPYWPDGGFIPYRPAAFRDTRYQSTPATGQNTLYRNTAPFGDPRSFFNRQSLPPTEYLQPGFSWDGQANLNQHQHTIYNQELPKQPHQQGQHFYSSHLPQVGPGAIWDQNSLPYNNGQPQTLKHEPAFSNPTGAHHWQKPSHAGFHPQIEGHASPTGHPEFKEKTLSWAHSVYVDLLASLHSARKHSNQGGTDGHNRDALKPNIYPKPPRQPASDFSESANKNTGSGAQAQGHVPFHGHAQRSHSVQLGPSAGTGFFDGRRHPDYRNGHAGGNYGHSNNDNHLQSYDNSSLADTIMNGYRTLRRRSGTSAPRMFSLNGETMSITEKALSALEMLASLCKESGWSWVDGMLVGGCLAYGLGDYNRAVRWYTRIINKDATHVEAISNLAASLLALDRREDAIQYWLRAIKLRPGYFEAAEHLIGLLCSSQRGKEAIKVIQFVENSLRLQPNGDYIKPSSRGDDSDSDSDGEESIVSATESTDRAAFDYTDGLQSPLTFSSPDKTSAGFGSSGYSIPGSDNGRILGLIHAKGNMLYALGDNAGAAAAFEDAILISTGRKRGMKRLIRRVLHAFSDENRFGIPPVTRRSDRKETVLLYPDKALQTAKLAFAPHGILPGFQNLPDGLAKKAAISTTSNSLLSLAKIYQDGMSAMSPTGAPKNTPEVRDILALYYLSLSLQPSPSTANNVGILLAGMQGTVSKSIRIAGASQLPDIPGVVPGSGIALALAYYHYGLQLDSRHAHLYTNLGSLLKDIGQLPIAIRMYEQAVQCDNNFDIALANLANAVKDSGRINDAIGYYRRAVTANPEFAEAVCGLANALNSVCNWGGRGGIAPGRGISDQWHVDERGRLRDAREMAMDSGWIKRVIDIVDKQLKDGERWGCGMLHGMTPEHLCPLLMKSTDPGRSLMSKKTALNSILRSWSGKKWEGSRLIRLIERAIKYIGWQWYQDRYVHHREYPILKYARPTLPNNISALNAPTVLPFHTFTCPLSAKQIRHISQRNGLRISCSTLRLPWLPTTVYQPPAPPSPNINVGYVSSDFNNHPLAHLMQSVFGLHNPRRVKAFCYATTASDNSVHRQQIEREAPAFHDASSWPVDRLVKQIVQDGIHILINLNGYTRGARNEVFAARPAPIHMSFMGFAGTLGAEWSDYILADELSIPPQTLSPRRHNTKIEDRLLEANHCEEEEDWIYNEKIVYTRNTFFCCDHRQSAPDAQSPRISWEEEQAKRWEMRKEMFPLIKDDTIILGNFNQLYKIEPTTFRTWLRILAGIPNAILWLLRFPEVGEQNLRQTAIAWAGEATASRIIFTDVAPKHAHISRARICDLFIDTPECNAHTTAADVLWSGTPLLTFPKYEYKMCSRMASSILTSALPQTEAGSAAARQLICSSESEYEQTAIELGLGLRYEHGTMTGRASGRLIELRKMLYLNRWESKLFDTRRWVNDLEEAYEKVWANWVQGEEKDIWL